MLLASTLISQLNSHLLPLLPQLVPKVIEALEIAISLAPGECCQGHLSQTVPLVVSPYPSRPTGIAIICRLYFCNIGSAILPRPCCW